MTYDPAVPVRLKELQNWFGSIITRPIDDNSQMNPISPSGKPMVQEACLYIEPSPTLKPAQRIQIYNQQYWWRLLSVLQESFPTVARLFGFYEFNQLIAVPYLVKYPPQHWSLSLLGDDILKWIDEEYLADDKALVYNAAHVDWAFTHSFLAPTGSPLDLSGMGGDISEILDKTLYLQSHVHLFELPYNMFLFRDQFMAHEPDYWVENDFPPLPAFPEGKKGYFILFRNRLNDVAVESIEKSEYQLLMQLKKGVSVDDLCLWLENQDAVLSAEAGEKLHMWFQRWTMYQLLTLTKL